MKNEIKLLKIIKDFNKTIFIYSCLHNEEKSKSNKENNKYNRNKLSLG